MTKGIIFWDIDGVFVDTEQLHFIAWNKMIESCGKTPITIEQYAPMIGRGSAENMDDICNLCDIKQEKIDIDERRRFFYKKLRAQGIPAIRENINLIKEIKMRYPDILHCAVSSARRSDVLKNIKDAQLMDLFVKIVACDDGEKLKRKPAPDLYNYAIEIMDARNTQMIAIEDSENGITAAQKAGLLCIAVPNALTQYQNTSKADHIIKYKKKRNAKDVVNKMGKLIL